VLWGRAGQHGPLVRLLLLVLRPAPPGRGWLSACCWRPLLLGSRAWPRPPACCCSEPFQAVSQAATPPPARKQPLGRQAAPATRLRAAQPPFNSPAALQAHQPAPATTLATEIAAALCWRRLLLYSASYWRATCCSACWLLTCCGLLRNGGATSAPQRLETGGARAAGRPPPSCCCWLGRVRQQAEQIGRRQCCGCGCALRWGSSRAAPAPPHSYSIGNSPIKP